MDTPPYISDSQRDARKFSRLLLTLNRAVAELQAIADTDLDIDRVLTKLLPDLATVLAAEQAFVAKRSLSPDNQTAGMKLVSVYPPCELEETHLELTDSLKSLLETGIPIVAGSLDQDAIEFVSGLELFQATSAIMVRVKTQAEVYVVGVCNREPSPTGPFLAADHMTLYGLVELIGIGARAVEQHKAEIESIRETLAEIGNELDIDVLLPGIARRAANIFRASSACVMLWNAEQDELRVAGEYQLSNLFARYYTIPRDEILACFADHDQPCTLNIEDLGRQPLGDRASIEREGLRAVLLAPLIYDGVLLGLLSIHHHDPDIRFGARQEDLAEIFAVEAAIAIHSAQLYEQQRGRAREYEALYRAGETIAEAGLDIEVVLQTILEQAIRVTNSTFGTLQTVQDDGLRIAAVWPENEKEGTARTFDFMPLDGPGITTRAVRRGEAQLVPDVSQDADYVRASMRTGSELAVVLRSQGREESQIVGVLNVEHTDIGGLTRGDERILVALANLAVSATTNAEQAEQLSRTNAVATMGAWGADVVHDINGEIGAIRRSLFLLKKENSLSETMRDHLNRIDSSVSQLAFPALPGSDSLTLGFKDQRYTPGISGVIESEIRRFRDIYPTISISLAPEIPDSSVDLHEEWLRRLLRHLFNNAARAVREHDVQDKHVYVNVTISEGLAEIVVTDNGKGVRPEIANALFRRPIDHIGSRAQERSGRGLLLVSFVAEQVGGHAGLLWSIPGYGSSFVMVLPVADRGGIE